MSVRLKRRSPGARGWWAPADIVLVMAVVAVSVFLIIQSAAGAGDGADLEVSISVNGKVVQVLPLVGENRQLTVEGYRGTSYIEIGGGRVRMEDSACPDKLCVRTGWISRAGDSIVCLPNRVVIEIRSSEGGPDVVNR